MGQINASKQYNISRFISAILTILIILSMVISPLVVLPVSAEPDLAGRFKSQGVSQHGTTYYVDGQKGNDNNNGTSPNTPWKSLDKVSATTFAPGDHVLLHAKSVWNSQMLYPKGSGSYGNPIVIDLYDTNASGSAVYEADQRPIINGNGTEGIGTKRTMVSGAVMTYNQEFIEFRNLEVTNSEDLSDPNAYKKHGSTQRCGILAYSDNQDKIYEHIVIKDCYVHDVQVEYYQKANDSSVGGLKSIGGIIILGHHLDPDGNLVARTVGKSTAGYKDVLIEGNIVQRVGLEGIRTKCNSNTSLSGNTFNKVMSDIVIRGNYLEDIAGDGIVLTEVFAGGVVENNVSKQACNADYGTHNYAGIWSMYADDALFQNNEVYGIVYGYNDGEAFDIDMNCIRNTYQYNYSHHNSGGFFLFMGNQFDSVVRYNISANDGGGNKGTGKDGGAGNSYTYKEQSIFHYWNKGDNTSMPTIYNNTFYVGDGISTALYGEGNSAANDGVRARFYNNILFKEGSGSLKLLANQPANGTNAVERALGAEPAKYMQNNIIWPESVASVKSGATPAILATSGNLFVDPKLVLSESAGNLSLLAAQNDTAMNISTDDIYEFTSTERIRERASLFKLQSDSPAIGAGRFVENSLDADFFGGSTVNKLPDIGAHQLSDITFKTEVQSVEPVTVQTTAMVYPTMPTILKTTYLDTVGAETSTREENVPVTWDIIELEKYSAAGSFTVNGKLSVEDYAVSATVTVSGQPPVGDFSESISVKEDTFIQGSPANTAHGNVAGTVSYSGGEITSLPMKYPLKTSFSNNYTLKLKNANALAYNRRFLVKFDVSDFEGDWSSVKNASIQLHISRYDLWNSAPGSNNTEKLGNTEYYIDVYAIDQDLYPGHSTGWTWSENAVTWENAPLNAAVTQYNHPGMTSTNPGIPDYSVLKPVAHNAFAQRDVVANNHTIDIDVSGYLQGLETDLDEVSFLVAIPISTLAGYNKDNSGFDAFSKEGAQVAYDNYVAGKLPADITVESATSLAPTLVISDIYEVNFEPINIETPLGATQVALPDTAVLNYSNGDTRNVGVVWDTVAPELLNTSGSFTVRGSSTFTSMPIIANVTVVGKEIVSFEELATIHIGRGKARNQLGLAQTATANLNDNTQAEVRIVSWEDSAPPYSSNAPLDEFTFAAGGYEVPPGVAFNNMVKPSQIVVTHPNPISIIIDGGSAVVLPGGELQLDGEIVCDVDVDDPWSDGITWSIEGAASSGVTIDQSGKITTAQTVIEGSYTIKATSQRDNSVFETTIIVVTNNTADEVYAIDLVAETNQLEQGKALSISGKLIYTGAPNTSIIWSISGNTSSETNISSDGMLTLGRSEAANEITVQARSAFNGNITSSLTIQVLTSYLSQVKSVTIAPKTVGVRQGGFVQFTAQVSVEGSASQEVSWSLSGGNNAGTQIDQNGMLRVDAGETATQLTVTATSVADSGKADSAIVSVQSTVGSLVKSVIITPDSASMSVGEVKSFTATVVVEGGADSTVTWLVEGADSALTTVSTSGTLTIGADETASQIGLKATANGNILISSTAVVTIAKPTRNIESVEVLADLSAITGMLQQNIGLPTTVEVTLSDSNTITLPITSWYSNPVYNKEIAGDYNFIGIIGLGTANGITNTNSLKASVLVKVAQGSDSGALNMLISEAEVYVANGIVASLVPSKKAAFETALTAAKGVSANLAATQIEVQQAYNNLLSAIWDLGYISADKTALTVLVATVENTDLTLYTSQSAADFTAALTAARAVLADLELNVANQPEVLAAETALQTAFVNLTPLQMDTAALVVLIGKAEALAQEKYTTTSWNQMVGELAIAKTVVAAPTTQGAIDTAFAALQTAISNLVLVETPPPTVDTAALVVLIGKAEALVQEKYTTASWNLMVGELATAKTVVAAPANQGAVDTAYTALDTAVNNLVLVTTPPTVDTAALVVLIGKAEALVQEKYTTASWNLMVGELATAKTVVAAPANQGEVDTAYTALETAVNNLVLVTTPPTVDTAEITALIKQTETLEKGKYTPESWGKLVVELNKAKAVLAAPTTQGEIDTAIAALETAVNNLVLVTTPPTVDTAEITALIKQTETLEKGKYTPESWGKLVVELNKAKAVLAAPTTQGEIDTAIAALETAVNNLVLSKTVVPEDPNKGNVTSGGSGRKDGGTSIADKSPNILSGPSKPALPETTPEIKPATPGGIPARPGTTPPAAVPSGDSSTTKSTETPVTESSSSSQTESVKDPTTEKPAEPDKSSSKSEKLPIIPETTGDGTGETETSTTTETKDGLSGGVIAAIVVVVVGAIGAAFYLLRRK